MKNLALVIGFLSLMGIGCRLPAFLQQANSSNAPAANSSNRPTIATTEPASSAEPTGDARADVIRASKKFLSEADFAATMEAEGKTPMSIELDYQQPDRFRMVNRGSGGQAQSETIIIGRDMYMKLGERWQKLPGALGKSVPQIREMFDEKGLESLSDVKYIGEEAVNGQDAYLYSYRNDVTKGISQHPFTSKIWVRAADGLPAKIEVTYEGGELKTMSIVYDYDKTVSIEPPVK
ncbi:MAG TPA: hypothetical protein VNA22_05080 [Pyrinomonadaceae bacterium]|nr:hypothetical protein [Pyrinomonadaceae bacterium]